MSVHYEPKPQILKSFLRVLVKRRPDTGNAILADRMKRQLVGVSVILTTIRKRFANVERILFSLLTKESATRPVIGLIRNSTVDVFGNSRKKIPRRSRRCVESGGIRIPALEILLA